MYKNVRIKDQFYSNAKKLRAHFDSRFENPLSTRSDRFVWDYWLVPNQYKLLRTPAESFFPKAIFKPFLENLLAYGRRELGCQMISHPWLSVYVDGCYQSLHSDVPHGPWSFVYSLTPWGKHSFKGGQTIVSKPRLLNYFSEYSHEKSDEVDSLFDMIEPKFNRLTLFDPRYPHGVNQVTGEDDFKKARVVIHGWFTEPRPTVEGALTTKNALPGMDHLAWNLIQAIEPMRVYGLLSLRITVGRAGKIQKTSIMSAHLINDQGQILPAAILGKIISAATLSNPPFPKSSGFTTITLPIEFKK
jgi:hypothetical protein